MPTVPYKDRQLIIAQALREIQFARTYKQGKVRNWQLNEDLYYGRKLPTEETSRANVDLGRMQEFVHTLLSKIDTPLLFKFVKRKNAQKQRVDYLNALRVIDQDRDDWNIKDLVGKKQGAIYGRAIYSYYADSYKGYCPHLSNVDVYDFLIDPSAGGIDIEKAEYLGDYGVVMSRSQLEEGMREGYLLKTETRQLLEGSGNATDSTQETTNQQNRTQAQNTTLVTKEISNPDKFKFWRWGTTYNGKRYYLLLSSTGGTAVRVEPLENVFASGMWWYWSYAVFPDLTEFWTPSYCDYVREIFMTQNITVNQAIDNAEEINKPAKVVDVTAVKNLAELKYQRGGQYIKVSGGVPANTAVQYMRPPSIDTPIKLFELLESIQEKASGVTAGSKGVSDEDRVGVYEGNQANTADRYGLLNKSYAFGYKRFANLYRWGVDEHLTKKIAVDIMGVDGVKTVEISRRDIFRKNEEFGLIIEASNAESTMSQQEKRTKITFLNAEAQNPNQNQKKAYEIKAHIAGFEDDTIRQLMDNSEFGDSNLMAEADRDIEALLDGKNIKPNANANTAYKQRFVDYLKDNQENLTDEQAERLFAYIPTVESIIVANMVSQAKNVAFKARLQSILEGGEKPVAPDDIEKSSAGEEVALDAPPLPEEADVEATLLQK